MEKYKVLEIRYGWGFVEAYYDDTEEILAFCQDVLNPEPRVPFEPGYFDSIRLNFLEPLNLLDRKNYKLEKEIRKYSSYVKADGKIEIYGQDMKAEAYIMNNAPSQYHNMIIEDWGRRNIILSPEYATQVLTELGVSGPIIENRLDFPNFCIKAYIRPIQWEATTWDSLESLRGNYVIPADGRSEEDWTVLLDESNAEMPERNVKTSCLVSGLCRPGQEDILVLVLKRLKQEDFDEYVLLTDKAWTSQDALDIFRTFQTEVPNTTVILSDDISGICRAWNRLFRASTGEYMYVNSSDYLTFPGHKQNILEHMEQNKELAWVTGRPHTLNGRCYAYSSCFRAEHLFGVGLLSQEFNPCVADDNDIAMKLVNAGYKICACAHTQVAHLALAHIGPCDTFHKITSDHNYLMNRQISRYKEKWSEQSEMAEHYIDLWNNIPWCFEV